jgi:hypothetical protein
MYSMRFPLAFLILLIEIVENKLSFDFLNGRDGIDRYIEGLPVWRGAGWEGKVPVKKYRLYISLYY